MCAFDFRIIGNSVFMWNIISNWWKITKYQRWIQENCDPICASVKLPGRSHDYMAFSLHLELETTTAASGLEVLLHSPDTESSCSSSLNTKAITIRLSLFVQDLRAHRKQPHSCLGGGFLYRSVLPSASAPNFFFVPIKNGLTIHKGWSVYKKSISDGFVASVPYMSKYSS